MKLLFTISPILVSQAKIFEISCQFVREKIQHNLILAKYVNIGEQLGDIVIKALNRAQTDFNCNYWA